MSNTPFFYGRPVPTSHFIGREEEIQSIFDELAKSNSISIYGDHCIGKTSLLNYIISVSKKNLKRKDILLFLDCQLVAPFTCQNFWQMFLRLLSEKLSQFKLKQQVEELYKKSDINSTDLLTIINKICKENIRIIILLDEFDTAIKIDPVNKENTSHFLGLLRALCTNLKGAFCLFISTRQRLSCLCEVLEEPGSPFHNILISMPLRVFTDDEVDELIRKGLQDTDIEFTKDDRFFINQKAGTHPLLVQIASHLIFKERIKGESVNYEMIKKKYREITSDYFSDFWKYSTKEEQEILMLILLYEYKGRLLGRKYYINDLGANKFNQYNKELDLLRTRGLITRINPITVFSPIFEQYVIEEIKRTKVAEIKNREIGIFGLSKNKLSKILVVGRVSSKFISWISKLLK